MKGRNFNKNGDTLKNDPKPVGDHHHNGNDGASGESGESGENRKVTKSDSFKKALQEAKAKGKPKKLFGQLWWQNELVVVFATTNVGKTVLAMQIGNALSKGKNTALERSDLINECGKLKVAYLDWELSAMQIMSRYTDEKENIYDFDKDFIRIEKNYEYKFKTGDSFEKLLRKDIKSQVEEHKPDVLIIDNLSVLRSGTESAKEALPLMHFLNNLKVEYNLSIMVVGHTPKKDLYTSINMNHLQGSAQISNALDGCFAIGKAQGEANGRYIIELKQRNAQVKYHSENVIECELEKPSDFLQFKYVGTNSEQSQLLELSEMAKIQIEKESIDNHNKGFSQEKIANLIPFGSSWVGNLIRDYEKDPDKYIERFKSLEQKKDNKDSTNSTNPTTSTTSTNVVVAATSKLNL